jgi:hypothetical protein
MKSLRRSIAVRHEEWGVALFVLPPLLLVALVLVVWAIVAWVMP